MPTIIYISFILLLSSCSTLIDKSENYTCEGEKCPIADEAMAIAKATLPGWEPQGLHIEMAEDSDLLECSLPECEGKQTGLTLSKDKVIAIDGRSLLHEIGHVHRWRCTGNPDAEHEDNTLWNWSKDAKDTLGVK